MAQDSGQYATFFVANLFFGVDVMRVQEVLRFQPMTRVPKAPAVIGGRLGLPPRSGGQDPMNIVVRAGDGAVSLLVDEIGDVLDVDATTWERPPENLDRVTREIIGGVYKRKGRLLLALDAERTADLNCGADPLVCAGRPRPANSSFHEGGRAT
jgi:purine-binding chemotaxis protein CheW